MHRLPPADTGALYDALPRAHPAYADAARAVAAELDLPPSAPARLPGGSLPVLALGPRWVIKLYPPFCAEEGPREADVLRALMACDDIPAPSLRATGDRDGWRWVVMGRLPGRLWADVDPALSDAERLELARQTGRITAALHRAKPDFDWPDRDWAAFVARHRAGAAARQARLGLDPAWLAQIEPFLADTPLPDRPRVLLHTEIMREHLFVDGGRVVGLFDFEPARVGVAEYDLASVGLFVAAGDPALMHAFLDGYGGSGARDLALQRRCLAWALLHEYSHLPWYLERLPAPGAATLDDLARRWWPL